jgi:hypothetical protein
VLFAKSNSTINVLLPYKDKMNYLTLALCTLREAIKNYQNVKVYLYNTSGFDEIPDLAQEMMAEGVPIIYRSTNQFRSIEHMYDTIVPRLFKEIKENHLTIIESDAIIHPMIFNAINEFLLRFPNLAYGSVFNTPSHPAIGKEIDGKYIQKRTLGFLGAIIRGDLWAGFNRRKWGNCVDASFGRYLKSKRIPLYCTKKSYIEHIGFSGKHKRIGRVHDLIDRATNFLD